MDDNSNDSGADDDLSMYPNMTVIGCLEPSQLVIKYDITKYV